MNPLQDNMRIGLPHDPEMLAPGRNTPAADSPVPFKDMLKGLVDQVDSLQKAADVSIEGLVTGETKSVHDVVLKMEEAGIAFDLMMKVRDKLLEAYQQVMRMQ